MDMNANMMDMNEMQIPNPGIDTSLPSRNEAAAAYLAHLKKKEDEDNVSVATSVANFRKKQNEYKAERKKEESGFERSKSYIDDVQIMMQ